MVEINPGPGGGKGTRLNLLGVASTKMEDIVSNFILAYRYRDYMISDLHNKIEDIVPLNKTSSEYIHNAMFSY